MRTHLQLSRTTRIAIIGGLLAFLPSLAQAHPSWPGHTHNFVGGLTHPLLGLDHVLAMLAVGLWAAQLGGRAFWLVPTAFVSLMAVGGTLGISGLALPMTETGIVLSVLLLGVIIAAAVRLPLAASMALVGLFAIFHGLAHGTEMAGGSSGLLYSLGFMLATAALHGCGMTLGVLAQKRISAPALRLAGAAIAMAGVCMLF